MRQRRIFIGLVGFAMAVVVLVVLVNGGIGLVAHQRPNLLVITMDTTRADHLGNYGYHYRTTPTLDALAQHGTVFEEAYAPMPLTGPSHASLFTGLDPDQTGFLKNGLHLDDHLETMAEILKQNGYQTAGSVAAFPVHSRLGFRQGFDAYFDDFKDGHGQWRFGTWEGHVIDGDYDRDALAVVADALGWLDGRGRDASPFFLWVHFFEPHVPYKAEPPYDQLFPAAGVKDPTLASYVQQYDGEIREMDAAIASLLESVEARGLIRSTLIVAVADHGEGLMQHGLLGHGPQLYEEQLHIPLILQWPGVVPAGQRLAGLVSNVDVLPTVLELIGIPWTHPVDGRSLVAAVKSGKSVAEMGGSRPLFFQRSPFSPPVPGSQKKPQPMFGLRLDNWKLIAEDGESVQELYDLANDPGETNNLSETRTDVAQSMQVTLQKWRSSRRQAIQQAPVDDATREALRALGYLE